MLSGAAVQPTTPQKYLITPKKTPKRKLQETEAEILNPCKEILNILDQCCDNNTITQRISDPIGKVLSKMFDESTYWDRNRVASLAEEDEYKKTCFFKALGILFAQGLALWCEFYLFESGEAYVAFRKGSGTKYVILFRAKKSCEKPQGIPYFEFKSDDNNPKHNGYVITIDFNIDVSSHNNVVYFEITPYENKSRDGAQQIYDVALLNPSYNRQLNFVANMFDNNTFNVKEIAVILNLIPHNLRNKINEPYFTSALTFLFRFMGNCDVLHQGASGKGRFDLVFSYWNTKGQKRLMLVEVKFKKNSASDALQQIKSSDYAASFINKVNDPKNDIDLIGLKIDEGDNGALTLSIEQELYTAPDKENFTSNVLSTPSKPKKCRLNPNNP